MRTVHLLVKLTVVMIVAAALLAPGDISWGDGEFYVVASGSPWKRNGPKIYYMNGNVGIGTSNPIYPFEILSSYVFPMNVKSTDLTKSAIAILGEAQYGRGVVGYSNNGTGVYGIASYGSGYGVHGFQNSGTGCGVYGENTGATAQGGGAGVKGFNADGTGYGVVGANSGAGGKGVWGTGNGVGVYGNTTATSGGIGLLGACNGANYAVRGDNTSANGYAVYANGNFKCTGNSTVLGSKTAVVHTSKGDRKLYSQESPEVWFEDFGEGQLVGGKARIDLDPLFLETVTVNDQDPVKVFIQLNDDCNGVFVKREKTGFEVKELQGGTSHAHFTYRVVAKRKGYETARLEAAQDAPKVAALKKVQK